MKQDIRSLALEDIQQFFKTIDQPAYRAKQTYEWLWKKSAQSFNEMTSLPLTLREVLQTKFDIFPVIVDQQQISNDRTVKSTFKLFDRHHIEGVLIPTESRMTACVSSQVGCSLSCKFCATGYMKRIRNVTAAEIYDQVVLINEQAEKLYGKSLTNIVFMGMGEPLLNYNNILQSIDHLCSEEGLNMSPKRITVSTAGIAKMIRKLGDDQVKFNLALSLHAANDKKRSDIMPINETNRLDILIDALRYYYEKTKQKITFEYILFSNFNDGISDAKELYDITKKVPCKVVNIIEYNPIEEANFINANIHSLEKFSNYLAQEGVNVRVRRSRGKDIDAACGQLANKKVFPYT